MLDFPDSPNVGDRFQSWRWDGARWLANIAAAGIIVSPTAPIDPAPNTLWFNSKIGRLFLWFEDPTSSQWVEVVGPGPQGEQGLGGTVTLGAVTTGTPGANAEVTEGGTPENRILNFVLPRGERGPVGEVEEAPETGGTFGRKDGEWESVLPLEGGGVVDGVISMRGVNAPGNTGTGTTFAGVRYGDIWSLGQRADGYFGLYNRSTSQDVIGAFGNASSVYVGAPLQCVSNITASGTVTGQGIVSNLRMHYIGDMGWGHGWGHDFWGAHSIVTSIAGDGTMRMRGLQMFLNGAWHQVTAIS